MALFPNSCTLASLFSPPGCPGLNKPSRTRPPVSAASRQTPVPRAHSLPPLLCAMTPLALLFLIGCSAGDGAARRGIGWERARAGHVGAGGADGGHRGAPGRHLCLRRRVQGEGRGPLGGPGPAASAARSCPLGREAPRGGSRLCLSLSPQDGRADVVANDAGDRVTPAVVAFSESEEVRLPLRGVVWGAAREGALSATQFFLFIPFVFHSGRWLSCEAK